jgi:hypothetical protein
MFDLFEVVVEHVKPSMFYKIYPGEFHYFPDF